MSSNNPYPYAPPASNAPAPTYPTQPAPSGQPYPYAPPQYAPPAQPSQAPAYGAPVAPAYGRPQYAPQWTPPPAPPRRPRRKLALVLGVAAAVVVLGVAVVGVALFMGLRSVDDGARTTVSQYYRAMVAQNYSQAYTYLAPGMTLTFQGQQQALDQATFTQVAQAYDGAKGTVKGYIISDVALHASTDHGTSADVTVQVQRDGKAYDVQLKLQMQQGGGWRIVEFDSL